LKTLIDQYKPAVAKPILLVISGTMWICVGIMLNSFAFHWLDLYNGDYIFFFVAIGIVSALLIHHFGFLRVVDKNLGRISLMKGKPCVFSFMSWRSYILVIVMVAMGITLRHSSIPKQYLSVVYIAIGLALVLSSIRYFRVLISQIKTGVYSD